MERLQRCPLPLPTQNVLCGTCDVASNTALPPSFRQALRDEKAAIKEESKGNHEAAAKRRASMKAALEKAAATAKPPSQARRTSHSSHTANLRIPSHRQRLWRMTMALRRRGTARYRKPNPSTPAPTITLSEGRAEGNRGPSESA